MPWTYIIRALKVEKVVGTFQEKELQKTNQKEFRIEKVIKRKGDKLHVKWKGYDNSFNSWIDKERYCYIKMSYFPPYVHSKRCKKNPIYKEQQVLKHRS